MSSKEHKHVFFKSRNQLSQNNAWEAVVKYNKIIFVCHLQNSSMHSHTSQLLYVVCLFDLSYEIC